MIQSQIPEALTFDDVLLVPAYSDVVPTQVSTQVSLTKNITLATPLMAAPDEPTQIANAAAVVRGPVSYTHLDVYKRQTSNSSHQ